MNPDPPTDAGKNNVRKVIDDTERQRGELKAKADRVEHADANATLDAISFGPSVPPIKTAEEVDAEADENVEQQIAMKGEIMSIVNRLEPGISHEHLTVAVLRQYMAGLTSYEAAVVLSKRRNLSMYKGDVKASHFEALESLRDDLKGRLQD